MIVFGNVDRVIDAITELTSIQDTPGLLLCVPQLLKYAHKVCETVDHDAVKKLDELMKSVKSSLTTKVGSEMVACF